MRKFISRGVALLAALALVFSSFAAQVDEDQDLRLNTRILRSSNTSVSVVQTGNTTLLDLDVKQIDRIFVQFSVATQALDAFIIQVLAHGNGAYQTIASAATDYTAPSGLVVGASGDLTTTAAAGTGWFILDTKGISRVKVLASGGNATPSVVTIYAGGH